MLAKLEQVAAYYNCCSGDCDRCGFAFEHGCAAEVVHSLLQRHADRVRELARRYRFAYVVPCVPDSLSFTGTAPRAFEYARGHALISCTGEHALVFTNTTYYAKRRYAVLVAEQGGGGGAD